MEINQKINIDSLSTEWRNENTNHIDKLSSYEIVKLINQEDQAVIDAVASVSEPVSNAVDVVVNAIKEGGRLIYMGAGTSGRLGVLDASEWLPTYGVGAESVVGIIAGGDTALRNPIENAEDNLEAGKKDLENLSLTSKDIVCAIASSGRTPYCIGGLMYAKEVGCITISISNVEDSELGTYADHVIEAVTGPEVITGSTRMKAGSAQKMILNIISTTAMVKFGKVYGNLMVDMKPTNEKLMHRAWHIIQEASGVSIDRSKELLEQSNNSVKHAIVMALMNVDCETSKNLLHKHDGKIRDIMDSE